MAQRDQVAAIGAAIGRGIAVTALTRDDAFARFARFMPAAEAEAVLLFLDDAAAGNSPATDSVEQILGRPALSFGVRTAEHTADFA